MAYSGTVSGTTFDTRKLIEAAYRRAKILSQQITAEYVEIANNELYLLLSDLANQGIQLWCIERQIYPIYDGQAEITLDLGTVDILNGNFRYLQEVSGTNTDASTYRIIDFGDDTEVTSVGILWGAASVPLALARSDDGATWDTIQTENVTASAGDWSWFDIEQVIAARYFRVLATSGTLSFDQIYTGNTPSEIPLARMNRDDYVNLPNKSFQNNRPLQYWFDRQTPQPIMHLWPVPNEASEVCQMIIWRQRYIMDVGTMTQEIEVPQRWYQAIVSLLAARLAGEIPEVGLDLMNYLDAKAQRDLTIAQMEERDNSPINMAPNISAYTA